MRTYKEAKNKLIAIVGIYPPPYGGVSIHLKRMLKCFDEKSELDFVFYNTGSSIVHHPRVVNVGWSALWLVKMLFCCSHKVIHFRTSRWWVRVLAACVGLLLDECQDMALQIVNFMENPDFAYRRQKAIEFCQKHLSFESHLDDYKRLFFT